MGTLWALMMVTYMLSTFVEHAADGGFNISKEPSVAEGQWDKWIDNEHMEMLIVARAGGSLSDEQIAAAVEHQVKTRVYPMIERCMRSHAATAYKCRKEAHRSIEAYHNDLLRDKLN
jgi:hypothetical protein